jgi:DNA polymerase-3 subunit epsilon
MKVLVLDGETSGLFDYSKRADEDGQPRLAEFSARLFLHESPTARPTLISKLDACILPDGWEMPPALVEQLGHGLTTEYLTEHGVPVRSVLEEYNSMHDAADLITGFNPDYDLKILRGEFRRAGMDDLYGQRPVFDIMRACAPFCGLKTVKGGKKNPKLHEAVQIILKREPSGSHRAGPDCVDTLDLFVWLRGQGVDCSGKLHVSKLKDAAPGETALQRAPAPAAPSAADEALFSD